MDEADPADSPALMQRVKKDALAAAKEIEARYYSAEDRKTQKDISKELRKRIMNAYGNIDRLYEAYENGEDGAKWNLCLLKTSFLLSNR